MLPVRSLPTAPAAALTPRHPAVAPAVAGLTAAGLALAWSWRPSLWTDEAATLSAARRSLSDLWRMLGTVDAVHGSYYLGMHVWVALAGGSAFAVRLPSALAVGLAAAALVILVRRCGGSERLALTAGLVLAVLPRTTWAGAEARSYAGTILLAVLLTLLAVRATARGGRSSPRWLAAYAVAGAFAVVFDVYLTLLLVAHLVTVAWGRPWRAAGPGEPQPRRRWVRWSLRGLLPASAAAVLLASPVLLVASGQAGQLGAQRLGALGVVRAVLVNQAFLGDTPTPGTAPATGLSVHRVQDLWQLGGLLLAATALVLIGLGLRSARAAGDGAERTVAVWAIPWAVVPPALVVAALLSGAPLYNPRYFTFVEPAVALLVALGIVAVPGRRAVVVVALLLVAAAPVYVSQRGGTAKGGADWAQVAAVVGAGRSAGQGVYFAPKPPPAGDEDGRSGAAVDEGPGVRRTLREIEVAYPAAFDGLVDVTQLSTPEQAGDLAGRSARLVDSAARLRGLRALWVVRRVDDTPEAVAQDTAFLRGQGFVPRQVWRGDSSVLWLFERGARPQPGQAQ